MESSGSQTSQPRVTAATIRSVDLVDAQVAFDQDDARRLPCGNLPVLLPHAAVKASAPARSGFRLSASFTARWLRRRARASEALQRGQQQQCEVGCRPSQMRRWSSKRSPSPTHGRRPGRFRRIRIAVAENKSRQSAAPASEPRDNLGAVAEHQRHLGHGRQAFERESRSSARMRSPVAVPPG